MNKKTYYCTYNDYSAVFNTETRCFSVLNNKEILAENIYINGLFLNGKKEIDASEFYDVKAEQGQGLDYNFMKVYFKSKQKGDVLMEINVSAKGIVLSFTGLDFYTIGMTGFLSNGKSDDCFAVSLGGPTEDMRAAIGKAASVIDNAVYNKSDDTAVCIENCHHLRLKYDYDKEMYGFKINVTNRGYIEKIHICKKSNIIADKYNIEFSPLKKRTGYKVPPAGWMTWYAVKFDACEKTVFDNVEFQEKHLKKFGADTIWVDWEWYHKRFESRRDDGVDTFSPDPVKYPNGLSAVSEKIRKAGFKPALWIGFTNDLSHNEYTKENPDIILVEEEGWCGSYFYDFSNPKYLNEFLPKAVENVKKWGYDVVKYDTLPIAMERHETHHENMYNPDLTTKEAYRNMIKKVRELLGDDTYMLSCAALCDADVLWGTGVFDAARVGNDVFIWEEFIHQCVDKVKRYYTLHNIVIYNDPDNVVLRDEFSTFDQAVSRISFVSLLGLPTTFGDDLTALAPDRVDLLKRALPVQDIHPMSITGSLSGSDTQIVNLSVELPFESYTVADILNITDKELCRNINLESTLHLEEGEYLVYDYFRKEFLGIFDKDIALDLKPYESRVLAIRKKSDVPQILSTSRHITQGAQEIKDMVWNSETKTLSLVCDLVEDDEYTVLLYCPDGYKYKNSGFANETSEGNILKLTYTPEKSGAYKFDIEF